MSARQRASDLLHVQWASELLVNVIHLHPPITRARAAHRSSHRLDRVAMPAALPCSLRVAANERATSTSDDGTSVTPAAGVGGIFAVLPVTGAAAMPLSLSLAAAAAARAAAAIVSMRTGGWVRVAAVVRPCSAAALAILFATGAAAAVAPPLLVTLSPDRSLPSTPLPGPPPPLLLLGTSTCLSTVPLGALSPPI